MNYSDMKPTDDAAGRATEAHEESERRERRLSRPIVAVIVVAAIAALAVGSWAFLQASPIGSGHEAATVAAEGDDGADGSGEAATDDAAKATATPSAASTGKLGAATDLTTHADADNGIAVGDLGVTLDSATLALDEGGHGWVTLSMTVSNPGTKDVSLGDSGLEVMCSQGQAAMAWDGDDLKAWEKTKVDASGSAKLTVHVALASTTDPVTVAVTRGDATMGWTVDVADAASSLNASTLSATGGDAS